MDDHSTASFNPNHHHFLNQTETVPQYQPMVSMVVWVVPGGKRPVWLCMLEDLLSKCSSINTVWCHPSGSIFSTC